MCFTAMHGISNSVYGEEKEDRRKDSVDLSDMDLDVPSLLMDGI